MPCRISYRNNNARAPVTFHNSHRNITDSTCTAHQVPTTTTRGCGLDSTFLPRPTTCMRTMQVIKTRVRSPTRRASHRGDHLSFAPYDEAAAAEGAEKTPPRGMVGGGRAWGCKGGRHIGNTWRLWRNLSPPPFPLPTMPRGGVFSAPSAAAASSYGAKDK